MLSDIFMEIFGWTVGLYPWSSKPAIAMGALKKTRIDKPEKQDVNHADAFSNGFSFADFGVGGFGRYNQGA